MITIMTKRLSFTLLLVLFLSTASLSLFIHAHVAGACDRCCTPMNAINDGTVAKDATPASPAPAQVTIRKAKAAEFGKKMTCPVTGESFKVTKDTDVAEYKGKTYYFCCDMCAPQFKASPEKYVKK
jgi:YHS domain-containing protein